MELERDALTRIMEGLKYSPACQGEYGVQVLDKIGEMTARLINRGHPAGYVVTSEGTFMVTVEMVSRAVMATE